MKLQKHHLLLIFPLIVSAFMFESTVWLFQRFNRFFLPSSFVFDALLVSFVPFAIYWHMKNWATCSKSAKAALVMFWISSVSLIAIYSLTFCMAVFG